jgi:hypothetical protein
MNKEYALVHAGPGMYVLVMGSHDLSNKAVFGGLASLEKTENQIPRRIAGRSTGLALSQHHAKAAEEMEEGLFLGILETLVSELGRLQDDWDGQGGMAPSDRTIRALESTARNLPRATRMPEIEVDGSDGSVGLRWYAEDSAGVFSLTVSGDEVVGVTTSEVGESQGWKYKVSEEARLARALDDADPLLTNG